METTKAKASHKFRGLALGFGVLWGLVPTAHAQSSVTLGGLLDVGVAAYSNSNGQTLYKMQDAGILPTKLFFRGTEDLGGGLHATFSLDSLFDLSNGAIDAQSHGNLFEDSSWVGLRKDQAGEVRFGRQNDFAFDAFLLGGIDPATGIAGGLLNFRTGSFGAALTGLTTPAQIGAALGAGVPLNFAPIVTGGVPTGLSAITWDRAGGTRMSNAVKFTSADFNGLSAGAMYSFGGVAGDFSNGSGKSAMIRYTYGLTRAAVVYTDQNYSVINGGHSGMSNLLAGVRTAFGGFQLTGMYSNARNTYTGAMIYALAAGLDHDIVANWKLGGTYTYENGNALLKNVIVNQYALQLTHTLSKRTSVYLASVYQRTNGAYVADIANIVSSGKIQSVTELGMIHRF